jgi:hypothetical protein
MSGSPWAEIMALNHTDTVKWWMDVDGWNSERHENVRGLK